MLEEQWQWRRKGNGGGKALFRDQQQNGMGWEHGGTPVQISQLSNPEVYVVPDENCCLIFGLWQRRSVSPTGQKNITFALCKQQGVALIWNGALVHVTYLLISVVQPQMINIALPKCRIKLASKSQICCFGCVVTAFVQRILEVVSSLFFFFGLLLTLNPDYFKVTYHFNVL